jgi:hypothetical protein
MNLLVLACDDCRTLSQDFFLLINVSKRLVLPCLDQSFFGRDALASYKVIDNFSFSQCFFSAYFAPTGFCNGVCIISLRLD